MPGGSRRRSGPAHAAGGENWRAGLTLEEFVVHAEDFARENGERGTLSVRHLQRLISRERPASVRPSTCRLLEGIFGTPLVELLGPPPRRAAASGGPQDTRAVVADWEREAAEVAGLVARSERVDPETVALVASQVENTRRLDRRFGTTMLLGALRLRTDDLTAVERLPSGERVRVG